ncbi:MAG: hypothetical protein K5682_08020 [Lachnospiraceae bacterium]|nr:hypothetical protein [Lachnospiraceae bacterium]
MKLKRVKRAIFRLPLENVLYEGVAYSEPVMTCSEGKIVDHFFTYSINADAKRLSGILKRFGVCADGPELIYVEEPSRPEEESFPYEEEPTVTVEELEQYEAAYDAVHEFVGKESLEEAEKAALQTYVNLLQKVIYPGQKEQYRTIGKEFFDWADKNGASF